MHPVTRPVRSCSLLHGGDLHVKQVEERALLIGVVLEVEGPEELQAVDQGTMDPKQCHRGTAIGPAPSCHI
eukprot:721695-Lingulodinium_polyedra.AAC.1